MKDNDPDPKSGEFDNEHVEADNRDMRHATTVATGVAPKEETTRNGSVFVPGGDLDTIEILESELESAFRTKDFTFDNRTSETLTPSNIFVDGETKKTREFDRQTVMAPGGDLEAIDRSGEEEQRNDHDDDDDTDPGIMDLDSQTVLDLEHEMADLQEETTFPEPITPAPLKPAGEPAQETAELPMETLDGGEEIFQLTPDMVVQEMDLESAETTSPAPSASAEPVLKLSLRESADYLHADDEDEGTVTDFNSQTVLLSDLDDEDTETGIDAEAERQPIVMETEPMDRNAPTVLLSDLEDEIRKASDEIDDKIGDAPPTEEPVLKLGADALIVEDQKEAADRESPTVLLSDLEDEIRKASSEIDDKIEDAPPAEEPVLKLDADALVVEDQEETPDRESPTVLLSDLEDEIRKASDELDDKIGDAPPTEEPVLKLDADALVVEDEEETADRESPTVLLSDLEDEIRKASDEIDREMGDAPQQEEALLEPDSDINRDAATVLLSPYEDVVYADEGASRSADTEPDSKPESLTSLTDETPSDSDEMDSEQDSATVLMPLSEDDLIETPSFLRQTGDVIDTSSTESRIDLDAETVVETEPTDFQDAMETETTPGDQSGSDIESSVDALTLFGAKTTLSSSTAEKDRPPESEPEPRSESDTPADDDIDAFASEGLTTIDLLDGLGGEVAEQYMEDSIGFLDVIDGDMDLYPDESDELASLLEIDRISPSVTEELETLQAPKTSAASESREPPASAESRAPEKSPEETPTETAASEAEIPSATEAEAETKATAAEAHAHDVHDADDARAPEMPVRYQSPPVSCTEIESALERAIEKVFSERIEKIMKSVIEKAVADEVERFRSFLMADIAETGQWIDDELIS